MSNQVLFHITLQLHNVKNILIFGQGYFGFDGDERCGRVAFFQILLGFGNLARKFKLRFFQDLPQNRQNSILCIGLFRSNLHSDKDLENFWDSLPGLLVFCQDFDFYY